MKKPLIIFGTTDAAELAYYYFSIDSNYVVLAFTIDKDFITNETFCNLPVIPFEDIENIYPPDSNMMFIALGYSKLNQARKEKYNQAKEKGYQLASYISTKATILNEHKFGDNCFILENNTIQPFVKIGNNVTLWSGNHIGHHSTIQDHVFIASHVVISGRMNIGESCFIGVNATFRDNINIGEKCIIGAGALILHDTEPEGLFIGKETERSAHASTNVRKI
nr:acetyltransferase [Pigmentibacter ruber]